MKMPLKVLIIDDELLARNYIRLLLKADPEIEIIGESGNGSDALEAIKTRSPDLIFLDVQMPEMNGFAMLGKLNEQQLPAVIFTTAYEEYALRAFEFHALDYLLKPFDEFRFRRAVEHAKDRVSNRQDKAQENLQITEMLKSITEKPTYLERLLIKQNGRIVFLKTGEIDWIKVDDKYLQLHYGKSSCLVRQTLGAIKTQLDPQIFVQVHRSVIINIESIKELQPMFGGEYNIVMKTGAEFALSRNYRAELFNLLGKPL